MDLNDTSGGAGDGGAGDGGAAGSVADFLGGTAGGDNGGGAAPADGQGDGGGNGGAGDGGVSDAFLQMLSADAIDAENPSNRDWIKSKGLKSVDDMAKSYREAERALRSSNKIALPGANATDEERAAFNKAIGVPDKVEDYSFTAPDGVQLDETLTSTLTASALKNGVPKAAFDGLAKDFIQAQLDQMQAAQAKLDAEAADWQKAQGDKLNTNVAHINAAVRGLGLTPDDNAKLRAALGPARILDILSKLGAGMAEDTMMTGGSGRFGVTAAEAQAQIAQLTNDKDFQKKVMVKGSPERARWERLQAAVAAAVDAGEKAG